MNIRIARALVLAALLLPVAYGADNIWRDEGISFLVPTLAGDWVVDAGQAAEARKHGSVATDRSIEFRRIFRLADLSEDFVLRLRAFGDVEVRLDGIRLEPEAETTSWKRPRSFRVHPHRGLNELRVSVRNARARAALVVEAPAWLRTAGGWRSAAAANVPQRVAPAFVSAVAPGPLQASPHWQWGRFLAFAWLAVVALAGLAALARLVWKPAPARVAARAIPRWVRLAVPILLLALSAALQLSNALRYPVIRSEFDWSGHVDYVRRVAERGLAVDAREGWETHQAPLYYALAAGIYRLGMREGPTQPLVTVRGTPGPVLEPPRHSRSGWIEFGGGKIRYRVDAAALALVQLLGVASALALAALSWQLVRQLAPDDAPAQWAALAFVGFLPVCLYISPVITNELFAAAWTAALLCACVQWTRSPAASLSKAAQLGAIAGFALLGKATASVAVGAGGVAMAWKALLGERRQRKAVALAIVVASLVGGWYYARSWVVLGHPIATLGVGIKLDGLRQHVVQPPSYRGVEEYLRFGDVLLGHPASARFGSFFDGLYASAFADSHMNFFHPGNDAAFGWMSVALLAAALPTAAIVVGGVATVGAALRRPAGDANLVLALAGSWSLGIAVLWSMRVPHYAAVKAHFLLGFVPVFAAYLARGRRALQAVHPGLGVLHDAALTVLVVISIAVYRYP